MAVKKGVRHVYSLSRGLGPENFSGGIAPRPHTPPCRLLLLAPSIQNMLRGASYSVKSNRQQQQHRANFNSRYLFLIWLHPFSKSKETKSSGVEIHNLAKLKQWLQFPRALNENLMANSFNFQETKSKLSDDPHKFLNRS